MLQLEKSPEKLPRTGRGPVIVIFAVGIKTIKLPVCQAVPGKQVGIDMKPNLVQAPAFSTQCAPQGILCLDQHTGRATRPGIAFQHRTLAARQFGILAIAQVITCLLYTSDAADERSSVDLGGRRIIKKKKNIEKKKERQKSKKKNKKRNTNKK